MSEPIKVGDLAMLVRDHGCQGGVGVVGFIVQIDRIYAPTPVECSCGVPVLTEAAFAIDGHRYSAPMFWLKRIPPLSELEGEKRDEEITA